MAGRLGILTAFAPEAVLVQRLLHRAVHSSVPVGTLWQGHIAGMEVVVLRCGMGAARATQGALWLAQHTPLWGLLSVGFAGGLQTHLTSGDAILATHLVTLSNASGAVECATEVVRLDPDLHHLATKAAEQTVLPRHTGPLLSVPAVATDAATKRRLGVVSGALAVDMESYCLGQLTCQRQLAFMTLRTIFDTVAEELPFQTTAFTTVDGALQPGRLWQYLWHHPTLLAHVPHAWWQARVAGHSLQKWLRVFLTLLAEQQQAQR